MNPHITRRECLAGTGLTIAALVTPFGTRLIAAQEIEGAVFHPNVWLQITPDNVVTVFVARSEMGQGVSTSLPMILADELEADWKQVRFKFAPAGEKYKDPVVGHVFGQFTGGSTSVRNTFETLRKAGAAAREILIHSAAQTWEVPVGECEASQGAVRHKKSGRSLTYGQLVQKASKLPIPQNPPLKKESQFRLINTSLRRLDLVDKVNGTAVFGMDVFVPDMLYASIARPPAFGARALSYDEKGAEKVPGVRRVVRISRGVAVCAETIDSAWKGRTALNIKWDKGTHPGLNSEVLEKMFIKALDQGGVTARKDGDSSLALSRADKRVEATYLLPYLAHVTMEPMNCTVDVRKDRCDLWVPTQNQSGVLQLAVKETGLTPEQIHVHTTYLGGGFGRRYETDSVEEALQLSKAVGKPIKLIWTREEDIQNDFYRAANYSKIEGGLDSKGHLIAWSHKIVCPSLFARIFPDMVKDGIDPEAVEGLRNLNYEIPNVYVEYVRIDTPVPVGFWRSVGSSHNAFTVESFIDELAYAAKKDPLEFRLDHLQNHPRIRRVVEMVAEKAGWGKPLKEGQGRGIAHHFSFGTHVAQVAEVSVNKQEGTIRVHRVVCAVDCGPVVVNPDILTAQIKGGILMGLSAALKERVNFANGRVATENYHNYNVLRISEAPEIEVHIVKSEEEMGGIGEPGLPPIAPALANAVFNASNIRVRHLPMTPETVRKSMTKHGKFVLFSQG